MRIIQPITIADTDLDASNVPENDETVWTSGATFALSDLCLYNHGIWQSTQAGNTGNTPSDSSTYWSYVSASNRWKAFDQVINQQVSQSGTITYDITLPATITALAFFNMSASYLTVRTRETVAVPSNLISGPHVFTSSWTASSVTRTADDAVGILGDTVADKMATSAAGGYIDRSLTLTATTQYCFSVYFVIPDDVTGSGKIEIRDSGVIADFEFDYVNGVVTLSSGTNDDYGIYSIGDGIHRVWVVGTTGATTSCHVRVYPDTSGNNEPIHLDAALVEAAATPSAYHTTTFYSQVDMTDTTTVIDWWTFFWSGVDYDSEVLVANVPGYTGTTLEITIDAGGGTALCGQIVMGELHEIGITKVAEIGIEDYSYKERDAFGDATLVERNFADTVRFEVAIPKGMARFVKRLLSDIRATPAVFTGAPDNPEFGTMVYGWPGTWTLPMRADDFAFLTLEVEGLT